MKQSKPFMPCRAYFITIRRTDVPNFDEATTWTALREAFGEDMIEDVQFNFEIGGKLGTPHWHWLIVFKEDIAIQRADWYGLFGIPEGMDMSIHPHNPKREPLGRFLHYVERYVQKEMPVY